MKGETRMTTTALDVSFLQRLTGQQPHRQQLNSPWSTVVDGQPWAWATDGYHIVAVRTESTLLDADEHNAPNIRKFLFPTPPGLPVRLADLKAWAGAPTWPNPDAPMVKTDCTTCKGTGQLSGYCHSCAREEDENCSSCHSFGYHMEDPPLWPKKRFGQIGVAFLDLEHVARSLDHFTDEFVNVAVQGEHQAVHFYTPDWIALVMPIRDPDEEDGEMPVFPMPE